MPSPRIVLPAAAVLIAAAAFAQTVQARPPNARGAVMQQGRAVAQKVAHPQINLTNAQREQVRQAVLTEHNAIEFQLKSTKAAKNFTPEVGATLPKGLQPLGFPQPVLNQLPQLRDYSYVKMKDQVLIVDAMTRKIVDVFSQTQPLT